MPPRTSDPKGFREPLRDTTRHVSANRKPGKSKYISWAAKQQRWVVRVRNHTTNKLIYVGSYKTDVEAMLASDIALEEISESESDQIEKGQDDWMAPFQTLSAVVTTDSGEDKENIPPSPSKVPMPSSSFLSVLDDLPQSLFENEQLYVPPLDTDAANTTANYAIAIIHKAFCLDPPTLDQYQDVLRKVWRDNVDCIWPLYNQMYPAADFGACDFEESEFGTYGDYGVVTHDVVKALIRFSGKLHMIRTRTYSQFMASLSPMLVYGILPGQSHVHHMAVIDRRLYSSSMYDEGKREYYSLPISMLMQIYQHIIAVYVVASTVDLAYTY